jgi:glycine cleavage system H protein
MDLGSLRYAKTHEWLHVAGDVGTIGITDFAVKELTDLVYIDLPKVGRTLTAGDVFGEVESVKAVSDLYAPVSGEVIEVNANLRNDLDALSQDPFGRGWLMKVRLNNPAEAGKLMDQATYQKDCATGH